MTTPKSLTLLSNCPLCDSEEVTYRTVGIDGKSMVGISCKDCGLIGPQFFVTNPDAAGLAQILWNDRKG